MLGVVFLFGCSTSSNSGVATTTNNRPTTSESVITMAPTVPTTTVAPVALAPECGIFVDGVCPAGGVDPRLVCIPNCDGLDLSGLVAPGLSAWVSFENADLTGADFSGAFVDGWSMHRANLTGATFVGANLLNVNFHRQDMMRANFAQSTMYQTYFCMVDLTNAVFDDAFLESVIFEDFELNGASFAGARTLTEEEYLANGASGTFGVHFIGGNGIDVVPSVNFGPTIVDFNTAIREPQCSSVF